MTSRDEYKPIDCIYYDILEAHATTGDRITIAIKTENGRIKTFSDRIINLETRKGEEFMILESGNIYRLDIIVSINGESPEEPPYDYSCRV